MKQIFFLSFFCIFSFQLFFAQSKVILDTDPSYDPDDVGCMAMLHNMATLGECEILAMINSTNHQESSLCISAINNFYNRKAIPVGDYKSYPEKIGAPEITYDFHIANNYPRKLKNWEDSADGVQLYREILASAADTSITIVIIGTMHNFYGLLNSSACDYSDQSGVALVGQKVKLVATMGGNFIDGRGYDRTNWGGADSLCAYTDWSCLKEERNRMCRYVIDHCPAPFMASGWEVGCGDYHDANYGNVMTGQGLKKLDTTHIVRRSYEYHFSKRGSDADISRHSNDQCALHFALRGEGENYQAYRNGKISLSTSGECTWTPETEHHQGYIQKKRDPILIAAEIEALMMGDVPLKDSTPPAPPKNIKYKAQGPTGILSWDASNDPTPGSWVVGYNVYENGRLVKTAYGNKYVGPVSGQRSVKFELKAVNVSGLESEGVVFEPF
ncbi:MAG: hypothetical protein AAFZ15_31170 [Bacteroidota bacterium]